MTYDNPSKESHYDIFTDPDLIRTPRETPHPNTLNALNKNRPKKGIRKPRLSNITFVLLLKELQTAPASAHHLSEVTGLSVQSIYRFLRYAREKKVMHISGWEPDKAGKPIIPVYSLGHGWTARRPEPMSNSERARRSRAARKAKASQMNLLNAISRKETSDETP